MRWAVGLFVIAVTGAGICAEPQTLPTLLPCPPGANETACNPSHHDLKEAKAAFARGVKLQKKDPEQAYHELEQAAQLVPRNVEYLTARESARQQLVYTHIQRGNVEMEAGKQVEALADFRDALNLDPANSFAQERVRDSLGDSLPQVSAPPTVVEQSPVMRLSPNLNRASFHFRGDSKELLTAIATAYGVSAQVEDSVTSRRVNFNIDDVDFYQAMPIAQQMTRTFWTPLGEKQMLIASDTPENRRQYERMVMRKFYIPGATSTPAALNDITNLLRNLFDLKLITPSAASSTLLVRGPQNVLDAATQFLQGLDSSRPQVMLDVHVYQVNHTLTRNIGVHIPYQFKMFNIPAAALAALGGQNIQDLINQLISSGAINQANNSAISALLAQLQGQQSQQNSIFSQPLATFGGGKTLMGVSLDQLSAQLSLNQGYIQTLDHATLRVSQGNDASFRMGSRYPILNASFAPVFNTAAISQVLQNNSFQAAFPSFSYEDLGLTIKAKPSITSNSNVSLQLEISLRALAGPSFNGVPVIGNREYKGSITLLDGEPAVVAGEVTHTETLALSGIPGLGQFPGLNKITASNSKQFEDDELLLVITPHITSRSMGQNSEVYLPK
jgi:type II secretory pathway component GspD/PulD (secretin)